MSPDAPHFLTVKQLAARWQMSRSAVYELLERQELTYIRLGGVLRIKLVDVEAYEQAGTVVAVGRPTPLRLVAQRRRQRRREAAHDQ